MSDLEKVVAIIFRGDDQVTKTIAGISRGLGQLEGVVMGVADPLARLGDGVLKADAALAAMVVGGLALAIRESGRFGDGFAEISTLVDAAGGDVARFRSDVLDYARDSRKSIEDINAAIYTAISAGTSYDHSLALLNNTERLSIAGKADLEAATRLLASTMNAYGENTNQAGRYSDVFFKTVKLGQTTLPELAQYLSQVTGIASNAGIPIETLTAALAALTATGMPTSQAVTGLKAAISNIIKPTSEAEKLAAELGLNFDASALKAKGFEGVLRDVHDATGGSTDKMARLFGSVEGLNAALVLASDTSGKFKNALDEIRNAAGATEAAYEKMSRNFELINQQMANNVRVTLVGVGDRVMESYAGVAGGVVEVLKAIGRGVDAGAFDPLFEEIDEFGERAQAFLLRLAEAMPEALEAIDWSGLLDALGDLGEELSGFFDGVDLTTPEGLAKALQGVVDTIESLLRITEGMAEYFKPLIRSIGEAIRQFNDLDEEGKKALGEILGAAELLAKAGFYLGTALIAIKESGVEISDTFNVIVGIIRFSVNTIQVAFDTIVRLLVSFVSQTVDLVAGFAGILPGLGEVEQKLRNFQDSLDRFNTGAFRHQMENMQEAGNGWDQMMAGFTSSTYEASDSIKTMHNRMDELPSEKTARVVLEAEDRGDGVINWMKNPEVVRNIIMKPELDTPATAAAQAALERGLPAEKGVTVKPEVDKEKLTATQELMKESLQWEAKVDIAAIEASAEKVKALADMMGDSFEANADIIEATFKSVDTGIDSTGDLLGSLFGDLTEADWGASRQIQRQISEENKRRTAEFNLQKRLVEAQTDLIKSKQRALERGESLIKVEADGLAPHLEAIWYEILAYVQVRANEEAAEFLLGIT